MKASEYVTLYEEWLTNPCTLGEIFHNAPKNRANELADPADLQLKLAHEVLKEFHEIRKGRNAESPEALGAIVRELNQKWHAICRQSKQYIRPELFLMLAQDIGKS